MSPEHLWSAFPAVIDPMHLARLCQPECIERTLRLLCALSVWQRAGKRLLYADRQGLRKVQALVLEQATRAGLMWPTTYLESEQRFPDGLLLGSAAQNAARGVLLHLRVLSQTEANPPFLPEETRLYQRYIRPLARRVAGRDFLAVSEAASALHVERVRAYIQSRLARLVTRAAQTRLPLSPRRLAALCIAPIDLLPILDNRVFFLETYESWSDLDESDRLRLDPEGDCEIAFAYQGASATFVFHLPVRRAETFVPAETISALRRSPGSSQERGEIGGKRIDEEASLARPARELLQELGIEVIGVCPYGLEDRQSYLARPDIRSQLCSPSWWDKEAWDDDPWDGLCLPPEER